ncbi:hypothetical protein [Streptomyces smyrnaeus]|uniref:hypothetical protein n=1 Tax=Streptomyces smyrnaeus TaxID=1387713 RepID=UPI0033C1FAE4
MITMSIRTIAHRLGLPVRCDEKFTRTLAHHTAVRIHRVDDRLTSADTRKLETEFAKILRDTPPRFHRPYLRTFRD